MKSTQPTISISTTTHTEACNLSVICLRSIDLQMACFRISPMTSASGDATAPHSQTESQTVAVRRRTITLHTVWIKNVQQSVRASNFNGKCFCAKPRRLGQQ
jgi:hypothetical protein